MLIQFCNGENKCLKPTFSSAKKEYYYYAFLLKYRDSPPPICLHLSPLQPHIPFVCPTCPTSKEQTKCI